MNTLTKRGVLVFTILVVGYVVYRVIGYYAVEGKFDKEITFKDAVSNYARNEGAIDDLVQYFDNHLPENKDVSFGVGTKENAFNMGVSLPNGSVDANYPNKGGSDIPIKSAKADTLYTLLKWQRAVADSLLQKLKRAGCVNIMSGDPVRLEFTNGRHGVISYLIFKKVIDQKMLDIYKLKHDTVIRNNVVVIYTAAL